MSEQQTAPGTFGWNELAAINTEKSKEFYSSLFGWTTNVMPMPNGDYTMFMQGDKMVAGMMQKPEECTSPPHWLSYINVESAEAAREKAISLGGEALTEIIPVADYGLFSIIKDPEGAVFAVWQNLKECN